MGDRHDAQVAELMARLLAAETERDQLRQRVRDLRAELLEARRAAFDATCQLRDDVKAAQARVAALEAAAADTADSTTRPTVTDAMVHAAWDTYWRIPPRVTMGGGGVDYDGRIRAALEAALAVGPGRTGTPPEATP